MRIGWRRGGVALATAVLSLAGAGADAQNLDLSELAAALALPIVTGGQAPNPLVASAGDVIVADNAAITMATVTNAGQGQVLLLGHAISGDPGVPQAGGDLWGSDSFNCLLTGRETATFLFVPNAAGSILYVECSRDFGPGIRALNVGVGGQNGILWVAAADPATWSTLSSDILFGDAVVADVATGQAYSVGAIPFQAGTGANDGDQVFRFDGLEYARWPGVVATNFVVPHANGGPGAMVAELILFTLDGNLGNPTLPRVSLAGIAFDDDEMPFDFSHAFDCFDIVDFSSLSPNFALIAPGSNGGHLQLFPRQVASQGNDVHDAGFGDGNNIRRRPVHGWIVQAAPNVGTPPGPVAWARPLGQGRGSLVPFLQDDDPAFDAD